MKTPPTASSRSSSAACAPHDPGAWRIDLRPLPGAQWLAGLYLLLLLAWTIAAIGRGQWLPAAAATGITGLCFRGLWFDIWLRSADPPRGLERRGNGELILHRASGREEAVRPAASSLAWGQLMLLVLRGSATWRLWLGPGNVPAGPLSALRRDLSGRNRSRGKDRA